MFKPLPSDVEVQEIRCQRCARVVGRKQIVHEFVERDYGDRLLRTTERSFEVVCLCATPVDGEALRARAQAFARMAVGPEPRAWLAWTAWRLLAVAAVAFVIAYWLALA